MQAEYWQDPLNEAEYRQKSVFLADINQENVRCMMWVCVWVCVCGVGVCGCDVSIWPVSLNRLGTPIWYDVYFVRLLFRLVPKFGYIY